MSGVAAHFIFYVADQRRSAAFYRRVLAREPRLDLPGMTEFELPGGAVLGLMPEAGIRRLLGPALPDPANAQGVPRAELYLRLAPRAGDGGAAAMLDRALAAGARELSPLLSRDWGDKAAYVSDPDGHVLAFAEAEGAASPVAPIVVRSATAADATAIAALATQVFLDTYATEGVRPDLAREAFAECSTERFVSRMAQETRRFVVVERGEPGAGLLGFAEVELSPTAAPVGGPRSAELVRLYVQPSQQRAGIGRALLAAAERMAADAMRPLLWLTAWEGNLRARAFYAKHGYADVGSADHRFEGNSYANRVLTKGLPAAGRGARIDSGVEGGVPPDHARAEHGR